MFLNIFNKLNQRLLRAGVKIGNMSLMTVRGRKSGELRITTVWVSEHNGQRWVASPYGQVQWVRNLRAAGEVTLTRGRRTERLTAVELGPQEAAPLLKLTLADSPSFLLSYYDAKRDSSLEDLERDAPNHPIFLFKSLEQ